MAPPDLVEDGDRPQPGNALKQRHHFPQSQTADDGSRRRRSRCACLCEGNRGSSLWVCKQLAVTAPPSVLVDMDTGYVAYDNDEKALQQLVEVASASLSAADSALSDAEVSAIDNLGNAAETAALLLSTLDTTTAEALFDEGRVPRLSVVWDAESNFTIVRVPIRRSKSRIELALRRLEAQRWVKTLD